MKKLFDQDKENMGIFFNNLNSELTPKDLYLDQQKNNIPDSLYIKVLESVKKDEKTVGFDIEVTDDKSQKKYQIYRSIYQV